MEIDPVMRRWDHTATWNGTEVLVVGGYPTGEAFAWSSTGGSRRIAAPPGGSRLRHTSVVVGDQLFIWSGTSVPNGVGDGLLHTGAIYDIATDTWREIASSPPEIGRVYGVAATLDSHVVVGAGITPESRRANTVGIYDLDADEWTAVELPLPAPDLDVWEGDVVWVSAEEPITAAALAGSGDSLMVWMKRWNGEQPRATVARIDATGATISHSVEDLWEGEWLDDARDHGFHVVGGSLVLPTSANELHWLDLRSGSQERLLLSTAEHCALRQGGTATPDGLFALGGNCTRDGEPVFGAYPFSPPAR